MASEDPKLNTLLPEIEARMDPAYLAAYQHQIGHLRADQVPYEVYNKDRAKYSFPISKVQSPIVEVGNTTIYTVPVTEPAGEIRVEIYTPTPEAAKKGGLEKDGKLPLAADFHGGGFVIGTLSADEVWCRRMCMDVGCIVANVEYRMSPEYPSPTPTQDCYDALKWMVKNADKLNIDPSRMSVSGRSAGGCIAAAAAILARDDPDMPPLKLQILVVPVIDGRYMPEEGSCKPGESPYESYYTNEMAPMLPLSRLVWFYNLWLGHGDIRKERANDIRASPIVANSHANLAPATFHVAEVDPLNSEAHAYHEKLLKDGTVSKMKVYKGQGHTFGAWDDAVPAGKEFTDITAEELKEAFKL